MYAKAKDGLLSTSRDDASIISEVTQVDPADALKLELDDILSKASSETCQRELSKEFDAFIELFKTFQSTKNSAICWDEINLLRDEEITDMLNLKIPTDEYHIMSLLNKLVVLKLNGGLGTSMGCVGPKSVINVRNDLTFLDMIVKQIETLNNTFKCDVPLVLMNSFNTDADTKKIINQYKGSNLKIFTFMQKKFPRIYKETLMPVPKSCEPFDGEAWYPPGHGDIYSSFQASGLLEMFLQNGRSWLFLSNVDNLGATVDLAILNELCSNTYDFVMEVTQKTRADIKGGTLIKYRNKVTLLEAAQVPDDKMDEFMSIQKFNIFNTNNLWVKLSKIREIVINDNIDMEIIVNTKTLKNGQAVIQLEQAAGAAIRSFDHAIGLRVPRSRFLPVKTTSDLLLVKSNLYSINGGELELSSRRRFPGLPLIKLGPQFKTVENFSKRFSKIPCLIELDHLTVFGDIKFGNDVSLRGTVIIIAQEGDHIDIPSGSILENKIVTGNLHILDH